MKTRQLALTLGSIVTGILILISSCRKINESTDLGNGLIPAVDNIHTFDTTLAVEAYNDLFTLSSVLADSLRQDSTRSVYTDEQFLGKITNDALFGKTDAQMFFELRPLTLPFAFLNKKDSLILDSVVLVLDYVESYGDTLVPQTINVSEIVNNFRADTNYLIRSNSEFVVGGLLGSKTIVPADLHDSVQAYLDTTSSQLRIRLSDAFGNRLLSYDSISTGSNNAYSSDSAFKLKFDGFALRSVAGGNALMGFNLSGANTKLAIYYRYYHGAGTDLDTAVTYFPFKPYSTYLTNATGAHNYVARDYSGSQLQTALHNTTPAPYVYIQTEPGSFATLKIPALSTLNNRVIHRAELVAEEFYDVSDTLFPPPAFLYLDAYSPAIGRYRNIPYDVIFDATSSTYNLNSFGVAPINALDAFGHVVKTWHFNLSRYVQHVVNGTEPAYNMRLFAPFGIGDQYYTPVPNATPVVTPPAVFVNTKMAIGRVKLVGNTGTGSSGTDPHRLRLHIIYSKI